MKLKQKYTGGKAGRRPVPKTVDVTGKKVYEPSKDKRGVHANFMPGGLYGPRG